MTTTLTHPASAFVALATLKAEAANAAAFVSENQGILAAAKSELAAANKMLAGTRQDAAVCAATEKVAGAQRALRAALECQSRAIANLPPCMRP
jgi:hypothetical protein